MKKITIHDLRSDCGRDIALRCPGRRVASSLPDSEIQGANISEIQGDLQIVPVEWLDCAWEPGVRQSPSEKARLATLAANLRARVRRTRNALLPTLCFQSRRNLLNLKTMKTPLPPSRRYRAAFTLIELLVVIAIIAILAAMLLPVLNVARNHALEVEAQTQVRDLANAIQKYDSDYGRFPVSAAAQSAAATPGQGDDFTYGANFNGGSVFTAGYQRTNDEVMAILLDLTNYPNTSTPTVNANYQKNPQQNIYLQLHFNTDPNPAADNAPGLGNDLVYRDPWGYPYVISMDLNYDDFCEDAMYRMNIVSSGGYAGLIQNPGDTVNAAANNNWALRGKVMVWSAGPKGLIDTNDPANDYENKDNVLSWK